MPDPRIVRTFFRDAYPSYDLLWGTPLVCAETIIRALCDYAKAPPKPTASPRKYINRQGKENKYDSNKYNLKYYQKIRNDAKRWMFGDDPDFQTFCDIVGIKPGVVRQLAEDLCKR